MLTVVFVSVFLTAFIHQSHAYVEGEWSMNIVEKIKTKVKNVGIYRDTDYFCDNWRFANDVDRKFYIDGLHVGTWEIAGKYFYIYIDEATISNIFKNKLKDRGFPDDTTVSIYTSQVSGKQKKDHSIKAKYKFQAIIETSGVEENLNVTGKVTGIKISNSTDDGGGNTGGNTTYVTSEYFPLGQGDTWTYLYDGLDYDTLTVSGLETIKGVVAAKIVEDNGDYQLMTSDSNGVTLYKSYKKEVCGWGHMTFSPAASYTPGALSIGETHSCTSTFTYKECNGRPFTGTVFSEVTLLGIENVSVPAGTFHNCFKFSITRLLSAPIINFISTYEGTLWWAKGVGKVKQVGTTIDRKNGVVIEIDPDTDELTEATVGGVSYPE